MKSVLIQIVIVVALTIFGTSAVWAQPLIVVHASSDFDSDLMAKTNVSFIVNKFNLNNSPIFYLKNDLSSQGKANWYAPQITEAITIFSEGGEHNIDLSKENSVTIVGGFFGSYDGARGCLTLATRDAIRMHFEKSNSPFEVRWPAKAIYFYEDDLAFRKQLIKKIESKKETGLAEFFEDFEKNFLLVDNFSEKIEFSHPYVSARPKNTHYRNGGSINLIDFKFHIYVNNFYVKTFGHGPREVRLVFE